MASDFASARLTHPEDATIPIKLVDVQGEFDYENGSVTLKMLVEPSRLYDLLVAAFPPPRVFGQFQIPIASPLPGLPGLFVKRIRFKSHDDGKPIDPFGFDTGAPVGTYHDITEVECEYASRKGNTPDNTDPEDPRTWLEITANTSGEYIHSTAPAAKWVTSSKGAPEEVKEKANNPNIPVMIPVPHTEWTMKWKQVPFEYFVDALRPGILSCMGTVNLFPFLPIFNGASETLLFLGYTYQNNYTWRRDVGTNIPPIDLEFKVVEKNVFWNGQGNIGHNHFWRPGVGWQYLRINDAGDPVHPLSDFNAMLGLPIGSGANTQNI